MTKIGSAAHRKEYLQNLIKTYQENIWTDEINIYRLDVEKQDKRKELEDIEAKLLAKEYKSANDGKKAHFVCEREIAHLDQEMAKLEEKIKHWGERIEFVKFIEKSDKQK